MRGLPASSGRRRHPQATSHSSPIPLFRHKAVADCSANGHCLCTLTRLIIPNFCTTCRSVIMVQPVANCSPSEGQVSWPSCRSLLLSSFPQRGRRKRESSEHVGEEDVKVVIEFSTLVLEKMARKRNPPALGTLPKKTDHRMSWMTSTRATSGFCRRPQTPNCTDTTRQGSACGVARIDFSGWMEL